MTERCFNVAGAMLSKLYTGRQRESEVFAANAFKSARSSLPGLELVRVQ